VSTAGHGKNGRDARKFRDRRHVKVIDRDGFDMLAGSVN
jgi:hypothetical protein